MFESNVNIAIDTDLGQRAIEVVEQYVAADAPGPFAKESEWPVARTQIAGLRQIVVNEPTKVGEFAERQRMKAQAKVETTRNEARLRKLQAEITFWELVRTLCEGKPPKVPWSLTQELAQALPPDLHDDKYAPGATLTKEQQAARKEKRERREHWQRNWGMEHYSAFFQRFCAQLLYELSKRTEGE